MWFFMTLVSVVLSLMDVTQPGNCECQTVVCPRMSLLFLVAQSTRKLAVFSENWFCVPSVASHFIEFSGVTWPKLSMMIWALEPFWRRPWSVATPMYFLPFFLNW
jgi:hypothetical protein